MDVRLLQICTLCPHIQKKCAGKCACTYDNVDILNHIEDRSCPLGKFEVEEVQEQKVTITPEAFDLLNNQSRGLGDTIAKITKATGIEKVVKTITGGKCGCEERQKKLNEIFPYKKALPLENSEKQPSN